MSTTKFKIASQVKIMLDGDPTQGSSSKMQDIIEMVGQCANKLLKTEYYGPHIAGGEKNAGSLVLTTYDNNGAGLTFTKERNVSKLVLPAMPIKLPMDQGCYHISDINCPDDPFIPIPQGQRSFIRQENYISDLLGQIAYERENLNVFFTKDLTAAGITGLLVKLVVLDLDTLSIHAPLPIPAEMEIDIIQTVYKILSGKQQPDKIVDPISDKQS